MMANFLSGTDEMDKLTWFKARVEACGGDIEKFGSGNKPAGTGVRKAMQDVKSQAQEIRKAVIDKRE